MHGLGLLTLVIGVDMALDNANILIPMFSVLTVGCWVNCCVSTTV